MAHMGTSSHSIFTVCQNRDGQSQLDWSFQPAWTSIPAYPLLLLDNDEDNEDKLPNGNEKDIFVHW
jgi:hypothetical protein